MQQHQFVQNTTQPLVLGTSSMPGLNPNTTTTTTTFAHNTVQGTHLNNIDPLRTNQPMTGTTTGHLTNKLTTTKGIINFRPIEGRFTKDKDMMGNMDPYVKFKLGFHSGKSTVAKSQGVNPTWGDSVPVKYKGQEYVKIKAKDSDKLRPDSRLGSAKVPLDQLLTQGTTSQWIQLTKAGKVTGEILVEMTFQPRTL